MGGLPCQIMTDDITTWMESKMNLDKLRQALDELDRFKQIKEKALRDNNEEILTDVVQEAIDDWIEAEGNVIEAARELCAGEAAGGLI